MTEDLGFPGNREIVERQLAAATTQVLYLAGETGRAGHRTLAERAAELVRGVEVIPARERFWTAPPAADAVAAASREGIPADMAEAYMAEAENILAEAFLD